MLQVVLLIIIETWKKTTHGDLSTFGTTATCALLRSNQLYIANIGDSTSCNWQDQSQIWPTRAAQCTSKNNH